jgi:hypothetical protein
MEDPLLTTAADDNVPRSVVRKDLAEALVTQRAVVAVVLGVAVDRRVSETGRGIEDAVGEVGNHAAVNIDVPVPLVVASGDSCIRYALHANTGSGPSLAAVSGNTPEVVTGLLCIVRARRSEVLVADEASLTIAH